MRRKSSFAFGIAAALLCSSTLHSELIHRYTFDVDASDSVGSADGTLEGGAFVSSGGVILDPGLQSYVNLPGGLIDGATELTIEAWASFGDNAGWARLYDFGDTNPDTGLGRDYIMFTPHSGPNDTRMSIADGDPGNLNEQIVTAPGNLDNQGEVHIVAIYEPESDSMRMYLNGQLAGYRRGPTIPLSNVTNIYSYIGRSLYPDPYVNGQINEFRIYDHAFSAFEAASSFAEGPNSYTPRTTPAPDALSLVLTSPMFVSNLQQPGVSGVYGTETVNLAGEPGVTFESSDTNVVGFTDAGELEARATGTAEITVSFQGEEDTLTLEVQPVPEPEPALQHRYSFNESTSEITAEDQVGGADGLLFGLASFTGEGELDLVSTGDPFTDGYLDLPNGIISALTTASFEMWVTFDAAAGGWQRVFDFGNNTSGEDLQGTGTSYIFFSPRTGDAGPWRFEVKTPETPAHFWEGPSTLPAGVESHVVITYNPIGSVSRVYINGVLMVTGTAPIPLQDIDDVNNWLGRSNFPDAGFDGQFDEFRIYEGILSDLQVAVNQSTGPDELVLDPGALQSIRFDLSSPEIDLGGLPVSFAVLADFANVQDVNLIPLREVTLTSGDTNIVEIGEDGTLTPVAEGTATLTAEYNGQQATAEVTVASVDATLELLHRYSFSEPPGSAIVEDTAGNADGSLIGTGTFTGDGQLILPGGAADAVDAGYVDLPNGMISALPEAVTIESWTTWTGEGDWQRIFDFGSNLAGEDLQGTGDSTFILTPQAGGAGVVRAAFRPVSDAPEVPQLDGNSPLPNGEESHVAVVYDYTSGVARLYVDGVRVDTEPVIDPLSVLNDFNNWLGRSNWPDSFFEGQYNEFRIWSGAMSDAQVAARFAAGPESVEEPSGEGPELSVSQDGNTLTISWPASATGYELEQTTALGPDPVWTGVTEETVTEGGINSVTVTATGTARFFRLSR